MIKRGIPLVLLLAVLVGGIPSIAPHQSHAGGSLRIVKVHRRFQPERGKIFIAVIGNDARSGNPNARADAIHIVGINTKTMRGGILNFPRDSYVNIPGHGTSKMNDAVVYGGPQLLTRTLESITGIRIDYTVMTGFQGFKRIIKGIGRVPVTVPFRLYDPSGSGADLKKGRQHLGPNGALSFVRTRHNFPRGDIDRTYNQAIFLKEMLGKLHRQVGRSPAALLRWLRVGRRSVRLDIPGRELFRLAVLASQLKKSRIGNRTVPVSVGSVGAASVVFISGSAHRLYARFRRTATL